MEMQSIRKLTLHFPLTKCSVSRMSRTPHLGCHVTSRHTFLIPRYLHLYSLLTDCFRVFAQRFSVLLLLVELVPLLLLLLG